MTESPAQVLLAYLLLIVMTGLFRSGLNAFVTTRGKLGVTGGWIGLTFLALGVGALGPWGLTTGGVLALVLSLAGAVRLISRGNPGARELAAALRIRTPETLLLLLASTAWLLEFRPLVSLPSMGDGIHHLFFFTRMLETGQAYMGKIPLLHEDLFGPDVSNFYPAGAQVLAAIVTAPLQWGWAGALSAATQLQLFFVLILSLFPVWLYKGARRAFPGFNPRVLFLGALLASTLAIFPFHPLGEGGFSRVTGQILGISLAWAVFAENFTLRRMIALITVAFPTLFYIHPSAVYLPGFLLALRTLEELRAGRLRPRDLGFLALAAMAFGAMVAGILSTARQVIQDPEIVAKSFQVLPLTAFNLFDRIKGPFHHLFTDPMGFGKFLSPRTLLAFFGLFVLATRQRFISELGLGRLRWAIPLLLLFPFALSLLIFFPQKPAVMIGMMFYHSVKRLAELGVLPLFLTWIVALEFLTRKAPFRGRHRAYAWLVLLALTSAWTAGTAARGHRLLATFHETFSSPRRAAIQEVVERTRAEIPTGSVLYCQDARTQLVAAEAERQGHSSRWIILGSECLATNQTVPHCLKRVDAVEKAIRAAENASEDYRLLTLPWERCALRRAG